MLNQKVRTLTVIYAKFLLLAHEIHAIDRKAGDKVAYLYRLFNCSVRDFSKLNIEREIRNLNVTKDLNRVDTVIVDMVKECEQIVAELAYQGFFK